MANLDNILAQAHRDGRDAAQVDYATGSETTSESILGNYPEAGDLVLSLSKTYETDIADEMATIGEAIEEAWQNGYNAFDVTDWLESLPEGDTSLDGPEDDLRLDEYDPNTHYDPEAEYVDQD